MMNRSLAALSVFLISALSAEPSFAVKNQKATKPAAAKKTEAAAEAAPAHAGMKTVSCYLETVSRDEIYKDIEFDSELTKEQKLLKKAAVPLVITLHVPPSVIERKDTAINGGSLSLAGDNYRGPAALKSSMRYVAATKSLEAEVENNGSRYTFTLHQVQTSTLSMPPVEKLPAHYEAFGKILNYSCQILRDSKDSAGAAGPKKFKPEVFSAFEK